ncbi:MAG: glycosyltransferase [Flavobacteriaceae bacterium]
MEKPYKKKVLITPLNWGLGHATRCIPIINALIKSNFIPIIASDGEALTLLQKEFPKLKFFKLPSYNITYPRNSKFFLIHFLLKILHFRKIFKTENRLVKDIVKAENIVGIVSDNRFGCYHPDIKSVYITHQLKVLAGLFTFLTSKIHQKIIKNFDTCWVPDDENHTYSGELSKVSLHKIKINYLGVLSRFKYQEATLKYDYLILISGPEPERSRLENLMINTFKNTSKKVLLVQGKVETNQKIRCQNDIDIFNYMTQNQLQQTIAESKVVIARSGYSTVMDLAVMGRKAFFIPTPGQTEQLYLAKNLERQKVAPFAFQHQFKLTDLEILEKYLGFKKHPVSKKDLEESLEIFK